MANSRADVIIIGGGLAGLCCARELHRAGVSFVILEGSDDVGGRVRTDRVDGFLLDRGFQVLLTAYPEAQHVLNYDALQLHSFYPGALVRYDGQWQRLADFGRKPMHAVRALFSGFVELGDALRMARLSARVHRTADPEELWNQPEQPTAGLLEDLGFTEELRERFLRPWFGGVFLDRSLMTSSRMFEYTFRMFSDGDVVLPADGMGAIPRQIAAELPPASIRLHARVRTIREQTVVLESGEKFEGETIVIAVDGNEAARLAGTPAPTGWQSTACFYYAMDEAPIQEPILVLNGDGEAGGPINNLCFPSEVAPSYAPHGQGLCAASVIGLPERSDEALERDVRTQLRGWFGDSVLNWRHLRTYRIGFALPRVALSSPEKDRITTVRPGLLMSGDHVDAASLQGAMLSGRRAAEKILAQQGVLEAAAV